MNQINASETENTYHFRSGLQRILDELKTIAFVDLACQAKSLLEKLFWIILGTIGGIWLLYFMRDVIRDENPFIKMKKDFKVADVKYPAITICSDFSTRYAIAERLGNLYDSRQKLPDGMVQLRENLLDLITSNALKIDGSLKWIKGTYERSCLGHFRWNEECKVK